MLAMARRGVPMDRRHGRRDHAGVELTSNERGAESMSGNERTWWVLGRGVLCVSGVAGDEIGSRK